MTTHANLAGNYRRWAKHEEARLRELRAAGLTRRQIAAELGRSFKAIKRRLCP